MRFYGALITNLGQLLKEYNVSGVVNVDSLLIETEDGKSCSIDFETTDIITNDDTIDLRLKGLRETFLEEWSDLGAMNTTDLEHNKKVFEKAKLAAIVLTVTGGNVFNPNIVKQLRTKVVVNNLVVVDEISTSENNNIAVIFID